MARRARPLRVVFPVFQCLRLYFLRGFSTLRAKVLRDLRPAPIFRPAQGRALIDAVPDIQSRSSLHQKPYDRVMAGPNSLVEGVEWPWFPFGLYRFGSSPASR